MIKIINIIPLCAMMGASCSGGVEQYNGDSYSKIANALGTPENCYISFPPDGEMPTTISAQWNMREVPGDEADKIISENEDIALSGDMPLYLCIDFAVSGGNITATTSELSY